MTAKMNLEAALVEMYRRIATDYPPDMSQGMIATRDGEAEGSVARQAMEVLLENIELARKEKKPLCQDTGTPVFMVKAPEGESSIKFNQTLINATRRATKEIPLRANAVNVMAGKNSGDNIGQGIPIVYFEHWEKDYWQIAGMTKGGGSENIGDRYKLPDPSLKAGRDLEGVRRCIIDTVHNAQGRGCPPYVVGVGIAAMKDQTARLAKEQLFRPIDDTNQVPELDALEKRLTDELNSLGIGPIGVGGKTAVLAVKIGATTRHPATFFVDVCMACWANRRLIMEYRDGVPEFMTRAIE